MSKHTNRMKRRGAIDRNLLFGMGRIEGEMGSISLKRGKSGQKVDGKGTPIFHAFDPLKGDASKTPRQRQDAMFRNLSSFAKTKGKEKILVIPRKAISSSLEIQKMKEGKQDGAVRIALREGEQEATIPRDRMKVVEIDEKTISKKLNKMPSHREANRLLNRHLREVGEAEFTSFIENGRRLWGTDNPRVLAIELMQKSEYSKLVRKKIEKADRELTKTD